MSWNCYKPFDFTQVFNSRKTNDTFCEYSWSVDIYRPYENHFRICNEKTQEQVFIHREATIKTVELTAPSLGSYYTLTLVLSALGEQNRIQIETDWRCKGTEQNPIPEEQKESIEAFFDMLLERYSSI